MAKASKFVTDKTTKHYAFDLYKNRQKQEKLKAQLKELEEEAKQLTAFIIKKEKTTFEFNTPKGYLMKFKVTKTPVRMVIDQEEVRRLLKRRTPYTEVGGNLKVEVDYVYED